MTSGVFAFGGMCDSFPPRRASDRESGSGDVAAEWKHVIRFSQGAQGEGGKIAHTSWTRARTSEGHHSMVWNWGLLGVRVPITPQHGRTNCRTAEQNILFTWEERHGSTRQRTRNHIATWPGESTSEKAGFTRRAVSGWVSVAVE